MKLHIEATDRIADLTFDDVDLAVRYGLGNWPGLHVEQLLELEIAPVCTAEVARQRGLDRLEALRDVPLVCISAVPEGWRMWADVAGLDGFAAAEELWLDSYEATVQAAEQGLGVALAVFAPEQVLVDTGRLVVPFECRISTPYALDLGCRDGEQGRREISAFRDWLMDRFR